MTDELKPVAWMYDRDGREEISAHRWADGEWYAPRNWREWAETRLYTADQLEVARTQGWNEGFEAAAGEDLMICLTNCVGLTDEEAMEALYSAADRIRALTKENSDGNV